MGWPCEVLAWFSPEWAWSGSHEQLLHFGVRKFHHSKSSPCTGVINIDGQLVDNTYDGSLL